MTAATTIYMRGTSAALSALKGDDLNRRGDPRLLGLPLDSCAVIFNVVALHASSLDPVKFGTSPMRPLQLERNAGGSERQSVPPRDSY